VSRTASSAAYGSSSGAGTKKFAGSTVSTVPWPPGCSRVCVPGSTATKHARKFGDCTDPHEFIPVGGVKASRIRQGGLSSVRRLRCRPPLSPDHGWVPSLSAPWPGGRLPRRWSRVPRGLGGFRAPRPAQASVRTRGGRGPPDLVAGQAPDRAICARCSPSVEGNDLWRVEVGPWTVEPGADPVQQLLAGCRGHW
jgi:hypothetical protein